MYLNILGFDNVKYFILLISVLYLFIKYIFVYYFFSFIIEKNLNK